MIVTTYAASLRATDGVQMKFLPTTILFIATVFCLTTITAFAQTVTYLDANYKPTTSAKYTYKRVIKYKEPLVNWRLGTDIYGNWTITAQPVSVYICSLDDYYKTGEVALIGEQLSTDINCSHLGGLNGQVISYYKNGNKKLQTPWKFGRLEGTVIAYNEDGAETERDEYVNGVLTEERKMSIVREKPGIETPITPNNVYGPWDNYENLHSMIVNFFYDKVDKSAKGSVTRELKEALGKDDVPFSPTWKCYGSEVIGA